MTARLTLPRGNCNLSITLKLSLQEGMLLPEGKGKNELGEKLLGGTSLRLFCREAIVGNFCREATIYLYRTIGVVFC